MRYITTIIFLAITSFAISQKITFSLGTTEPIKIVIIDSSNVSDIYPPSEESFNVPDRYPSFPGRMKSLNDYIKKNGKLIDHQISSGGVIYIEFIINEKGKAERIRIIKGFDNDKCNQEAIRLIWNMPKWIPAEDNGHEVKNKMILPILVEVK